MLLLDIDQHSQVVVALEDNMNDSVVFFIYIYLRHIQQKVKFNNRGGCKALLLICHDDLWLLEMLGCESGGWGGGLWGVGLGVSCQVQL